MAFDSLQDKLTRAIKNVQGKGRLSDRNMEETLNEIRVALLEADVNYEVTQNFLKRIKEEAIGKEVLTSVEPGQQLVKIVHDELVKLLGDNDNTISYNTNGLTVIMVVGLQGTGKTTHVAKIARQMKLKENKKPLIIAADVIRPAAIEQLQTLGKAIDVEVFTKGIFVNAVNTCKQGIKYAEDNGYDVVLIDTAGRLQINDKLMEELVDIKKDCKPNEILLTVDSMTGQDICNVAKVFNDLLDVTGLIVTKFDGDAKGGAVLSVKAMTQVPIKYLGVGEKIEDLDVFYPDRLAQRILGMGDVVSLVEKAQEEMDMKAAEDAAKRMLSGKFTLDDMLVQLEQSTKLGPLSSLMGMIPGMSDYKNQVDDEQVSKGIKVTKAVIQSMTKKEKADPSRLLSSNKRRIAAGSGTTVNDVNKVINQYDRTKKLMKQMSGMKGLMGMFK